MNSYYISINDILIMEDLLEEFIIKDEWIGSKGTYLRRGMGFAIYLARRIKVTGSEIFSKVRFFVIRVTGISLVVVGN